MEERNSDLRERLRAALSAGMEGQFQVDDELLTERIDAAIQQECEKNYLDLGQRIRLRKELYDSFRRLDILQELVDDPDVTEIMVNGTDRIFVEKKGRILRWDRGFSSTEQLEDLIQQVVSRVNRTVNFASPIADARLEDGSRVHVVLPPVALDGPTLTIRKFPEAFDMERLIFGGSITEEAADFLEKLVKAGYNIFVSGGTGSGKTTFLNALSGFIPSDERIITIEDSAELQIRHIPNLVRLETRAGNGEGADPVTMTDLIRASLRMRPTRIIVGEVRGAEALDMLQAMNTGHDGSLSTGHANSAADMLLRLETMVLMAASDLPLAAVRMQIASGLDIIVHLGRLRDRSRRVLEITEVLGYEDGCIRLNPLYRFEEDAGRAGDKDMRQTPSGKTGEKEKVKGCLRRTGDLVHREKLAAAGIRL
ncbi:MAG: CpaF family protein [Clostridium sp.]|nr:CpaF family protein [Clostridium sp.]